jgi:hypothetical protein
MAGVRLVEAATMRASLKTEGRRPKAENTARRQVAARLTWLWIRTSEFGLLSTFGLRPSDLEWIVTTSELARANFATLLLLFHSYGGFALLCGSRA